MSTAATIALLVAALGSHPTDAATPLSARAAAPKPVSGKLTLTSLDSNTAVAAQFNPKEITIDKQVPWTRSKSSVSDRPELQFTAAEGRSMSFELLFDTMETKTDVHAAYVAKLLALATIIDPDGPEDKRRPPRIKVTGVGAIAFEGVIESISVRYTSLLPDGTPVRATCTVKLKEASRASFRR